MIIAFAIHFLFIVGALALVYALLYHYRRYEPPEDHGSWINSLFLTIIVGLAIVSTALFFFVPWNEISALINI
ncbi:MAG: hypothetical protein AAB930_01630 [Patescibacteria group bacterium]